MKKNFLIGLFLLLCNFAFSEGNLITIDNTRHIYEDNFKVINNTSEIISLDIFVKRKVNSEENKVGSGVVAPKKTDFQIKTRVDGNFDDYDYILIRPVGNLIDYKIECKHDDIILTINSYEGIENELVSSVASLYSNEIMFENKNYEWRDYIKVTNKTDSFISCSLYGIPKDTEKEVFIGNGIIDPNGKTAIKTIYDGRLKELYSIRFTTDAIIKEYESNSSSHDLNIIVFSCEGGESPLKLKFENDYNKDDIIVDIRGKVKRERDGLYIYSFYADITNKNGKIIKIKFDESSLSYNGNTSLPFIDGQKYITAGNPPSNKIIPNGGTSSFSLFSANQISWTGNNWRISSMGDDVTVVLAIEVDSKTYYWITYAKVNN